MADTAAIPEINRFITERQTNILNRLFDGVTTGADLAEFEALRQLLATIPAFEDEGPERWFWQDDIDTDLRTEPEDISEEDMAHIHNVLGEIFASGDTSPEQTELTAHLYLLSLDRNFELPDGKTAVEFLEENPIIAIKGDLRWLSARGPDNEPSAFGRDFEVYNIDPNNLTNATSPEFIETFGAALRVIQTDMRNLGITPPGGADAFVDPALFMNAETQPYYNQVVEAIITRLGDNDELTAIRALTGDERIQALNQYVSQLDDANPDKAVIQEQLEVFAANGSPMRFVEIAVEYGVLDQGDLLRARLHDIDQIGADKTGMFGENTQELLQAYLDYAAASQEFQTEHASQSLRADYFSRLYTTYLELPDDQRNAISAALEARAGDAPGVHVPTTPEEDEEAARRAADRERYRGHYEVLESAGRAMGVPAAIIADVDPRLISGVTAAHYDEGFERGMRRIFSENWMDTYGIRRPASDDPSERIGGDDNLWRYRYPNEECAEFVNTYFTTHANNLLVQSIAGQTEDPMERFELMKAAVARLDPNDPLAVGFAELTLDVNANSMEYHIDPQTGEIATYRVGANGVDLYTNVGPGNGQPIVLDGEFPDFDIFHPNFVTRDLLISLSEQAWQRHYEENRDFYEERGITPAAQPTVRELDQALESLEQNAFRAIQALQPDLDEEGVSELYGDLERALASPEHFYRMKLARENPDMEEADLERRLAEIMANYDKIELMKDVLQARESSESVVFQLNTYLIQMQSLEELRDITSMRDYTNLMVDGLLPDGSTVTPPAIENPWGQDFSTFYENNSFRWERATEFRTWTPELYDSYRGALNNGLSMSVSLFDHDEYAQAYIEAQGWTGSINYIQASMVARAMMIKEAADRHGVDPNSPEAREAFLEDYRAGYYNKHDIEIMMRAFDADGAGRAANRESYDVAWRTTSFDDAADVDHRIDMFHEMFKQPVEIPGLTNADGTPRIVESTLTVEEATLMFWRDYMQRRELTDPETGQPYLEAYYGLDYDTMLERHGEEFAERIAHIMERNTYYNMTLLTDVNNPTGAFDAMEVRRYQAMYQQRLELQYKEEHEVISPPPEVNVGATPTLDPTLDTITPMPESERPRGTADHLQVNNSDLIAGTSSELTEPTPAVIAATGGGLAPPDARPGLDSPAMPS